MQLRFTVDPPRVDPPHIPVDPPPRSGAIRPVEFKGRIDRGNGADRPGGVRGRSAPLECSGGASFFEWGGQRGAKTFLGGQVYMVANMHSHNTGHILDYPKFPSISLDLSFLFASCDSFPFHFSFIPISRPPLLSYS